MTANKYPAELRDRNGLFCGVWSLARRLSCGGSKYREPLEHELKSQIEFLLDRGVTPTHLNGHQYADTLPVVSTIIPILMRRYAIPVARVPCERGLTTSTLLRHFEPANWLLGQIKRLFAMQHRRVLRRARAVSPQSYFGTSHAGRIDLERMLIFLHASPAGLTEVGMHPGCPPVAHSSTTAAGWFDPLAEARPAELELLKSPELALLLEMHQFTLGRLAELVRPRQFAAAA